MTTLKRNKAARVSNDARRREANQASRRSAPENDPGWARALMILIPSGLIIIIIFAIAIISSQRTYVW